MDGSGLNDEQDHGHFSLMWQFASLSAWWKLHTCIHKI